MTGNARYYALRRVNPFLGTLQVVEVAGARGISPNGARWQVELLSQTAVRQPLWADIGPASAERRFFTYAVWSRREGLRRLPVNPMLGDQSTHPGLAPLVEALEGMPGLPFALADGLELWLLDPEHQPLALVAAIRAETTPTFPSPPFWRALAAREGNAPAGASEPSPPDVRGLERSVAGLSGSPSRAQWLRRGDDGAGIGLSGFRLDPSLVGRRLPASAFPEVLIREDWPDDPPTGTGVAALVAWQAPMLLALGGLSRATRARLEPLAAHRPLTLYRLRRLIPEVIDRPLIEAALVEAVIRSTT